MPWLAHSSFAAGPRLPRSRDQRRIWLVRVDLHVRAGALTALHERIARFLLSRLSADGRLDPGHDRIAADVGCCPRTVRTALRRLRWLGLLGWQRRLVRVANTVRQWSNAYEISLTGSPAPVAVATIQAKAAGQSAEASRDRQMEALAGWAVNSLPTHRQTVCLERADRPMIAGQTFEGKPWQTTTTGPSRR